MSDLNAPRNSGGGRHNYRNENHSRRRRNADSDESRSFRIRQDTDEDWETSDDDDETFRNRLSRRGTREHIRWERKHKHERERSHDKERTRRPHDTSRERRLYRKEEYGKGQRFPIKGCLKISEGQDQQRRRASRKTRDWRSDNEWNGKHLGRYRRNLQSDSDIDYFSRSGAGGTSNHVRNNSSSSIESESSEEFCAYRKRRDDDRYHKSSESRESLSP